MKSNLTRIEELEARTANIRIEPDLSMYTYEELKALAEVGRAERVKGCVPEEDLKRYKKIVEKLDMQ